MISAEVQLSELGGIERLKARWSGLLLVGMLAVAKYLSPDIEQQEWGTTVPSAAEVEYYKGMQLISASTVQPSGMGIAEHNNPPTTTPDWIGVSAPNPPGVQEPTEVVPTIQPDVEIPVQKAHSPGVAQAEQTTASFTNTEIATPTVTVPFAQGDTSDRATLPAAELGQVTEAIEPVVVEPAPQKQYSSKSMDVESTYPYYEVDVLPGNDGLASARDFGTELIFVVLVVASSLALKNYVLLKGDAEANHSPFGNQG